MDHMFKFRHAFLILKRKIEKNNKMFARIGCFDDSVVIVFVNEIVKRY